MQIKGVEWYKSQCTSRCTWTLHIWHDEHSFANTFQHKMLFMDSAPHLHQPWAILTVLSIIICGRILRVGRIWGESEIYAVFSTVARATRVYFDIFALSAHAYNVSSERHIKSSLTISRASRASLKCSYTTCSQFAWFCMYYKYNTVDVCKCTNAKWWHKPQAIWSSRINNITHDAYDPLFQHPAEIRAISITFNTATPFQAINTVQHVFSSF